MSPSPPKNILIIGAGITGLQTALHLQRSMPPTTTITIVAEHAPGDTDPFYASPWAGAQWRSHAGEGEEDAEERGWDAEGYNFWMEEVRREGGGRSGIGITPSTIYQSAPPPSPTPWWTPLVHNLQIHPHPSTTTFTTLTLNVPHHLHHLLTLFHTSHGLLLKARLPTSAGLSATLAAAAALVKEHGSGSGDVDVFVNCSGLGARWLVPDAGVFPIKGQTVLVRGEARGARTVVGGEGEGEGDRYVIPRPGSGTSVLGGTRERGNWDTSVDDGVTEAILRDCKGLAPELVGDDGEFEVLSVQCGLRPAREGGARVEGEVLEGGEKVVHSYGHGGAGYQNSVGCARKVVRLVKELEGQVGKGAKL